MSHLDHRFSGHGWHRELLPFLLRITLALPMLLSLLFMLGVPLSEGVWATHVLIGMGIVFICGVLSLTGAKDIPIYALYAVCFFIGTFVMWYLWLYPKMEWLAYCISAVFSFLATLVVWGKR